MYELFIYMDGDIKHYAKVSEESLNAFRVDIGEDVSPKFVEVECGDNGSTLAINRYKVNAYEYKEADE